MFKIIKDNLEVKKYVIPNSNIMDNTDARIDLIKKCHCSGTWIKELNIVHRDDCNLNN